MITHGGHAVQGVVAVSEPAYLESAPFVAPDAPGLGLMVHQPGSGAALRPGDGRVTGISYSGGLLWAGAVLVGANTLGQTQEVLVRASVCLSLKPCRASSGTAKSQRIWQPASRRWGIGHFEM